MYTEKQNSRTNNGKNVIILGFVSLFTDMSTQMIFPLLPLFISTVIGAGPAFLGTLEGIGEALASLLRVFSGWLSDVLKKRKPVLYFVLRPLLSKAPVPLSSQLSIKLFTFAILPVNVSAFTLRAS